MARRSYLSEKDFRVLYGLYLNGYNLYLLADESWEKYGYASSESFRLSFRGRCVRMNLPLRDCSASRKSKEARAKEFSVLRARRLTPQEREELKAKISEAQKERYKRALRLERSL
jgi:hypothetical protein